MLSDRTHSLLGQFTDLTFSREENKNKVIRCGFFNLSNGIFWVLYEKFDWIILKIWSLLLFSQSVREIMGDWKERSVNRPRREWIPSDNTLVVPLTTSLLWNFNTYLLIESCPSSRDQKCTLLWMQLRAILEHMWIGHYLSSSSSLLLSEHLQTNSSSKATTIDSTLCHGGKNNGIKWFQDEDVHFSCHSQKMRPGTMAFSPQKKKWNIATRCSNQRFNF